MKFCYKCGKQLTDDAAFCIACGAAIAPGTVTTQNQVPDYRQTPNYNQVPNYRQTTNYNQALTYRQAPNYNQTPNYNQVPNYRQAPNYNQVPNYNKVPNYNQGYAPYAGNPQQLVQELSNKINTNAIIWIVIGACQILFGFIAILPAIVGVLNIISGVNDMKYSKAILTNPVGIVRKYEPTTSAIITLVYNILIGGVVGVVGSIYYFVAIRAFVMDNKETFLSLENNR